MATQLVLERDFPNRVVFDPAHGLDPTLHLSLRGAQVRSSVARRKGDPHVSTCLPDGLLGMETWGLNALQVRAVVEGRASAWQKHLTLTPTKPGASEAVSPCHIHCSLVCMRLCLAEAHGGSCICL